MADEGDITPQQPLSRNGTPTQENGWKRIVQLEKQAEHQQPTDPGNKHHHNTRESAACTNPDRLTAVLHN